MTLSVPHRLLLINLMILAAQVGAGTVTERVRTYLETEFPERIERIDIHASGLILSGRTAGSAGVYVAELQPQHSSSEPSQWKRIGALRNGEGVFRFEIPELRPESVLLRYALVSESPAGLVQRSAAAWPDWGTQAASNVPRPAVRSRKGLNGIHPDPALLPDLVELGVGHVALNMTLENLLVAPERGEAYDAGFAQIWIDPKALANFDRVVEFCAKNGIEPTVILLNPRRHVLKELPHPDASDGAFSAPNMKTGEGARLYAASIQFLAQRYAPRSRIGRVSRWIVGNEVDSAWEWTNMGEKSAHEFMDEFVRALRIVDALTRQVDANSRTYLSLTHFWMGKGGGRDNPRYYRGRELLEILSRFNRAEGDFPWGLAYHPYPENLFNPKTWEDGTATDSFETLRITFKNLDVLDRFMKQKAFLYRGESMRSVLLSEQGFNSGKNSPDELRSQAAAMAYAWRKIKTLDSIEAFHYHRWIDHEHEGGLNLGLWTVKKGSVTWPETRKPVYALFKALDTPEEESALRSAWDREVHKK